MRPLTKDEMKRQAKAAKKIDSKKQQACQMQAMNHSMARMQQAMAEAQQKMATAKAGGGLTEAPNESIELAADPVGELKKGKTAARNIDWVAGTGQVSPAGQAAFADAMAKLGSAMRAAGRQYRLDLYLDQRYDEVAVSTIGPQRLAVAQAALALGGIATDAVALGKTKRDKNPRLEVVRAK